MFDNNPAVASMVTFLNSNRVQPNSSRVSSEIMLTRLQNHRKIWNLSTIICYRALNTLRIIYTLYNFISFGCNYLVGTMKRFVKKSAIVPLRKQWIFLSGMCTVFYPRDVFTNPNALCARNGKSRPEIPLLFKERYALGNGFSVLQEKKHLSLRNAIFRSKSMLLEIERMRNICLNKHPSAVSCSLTTEFHCISTFRCLILITRFVN